MLLLRHLLFAIMEMKWDFDLVLLSVLSYKVRVKKKKNMHLLIKLLIVFAIVKEAFFQKSEFSTYPYNAQLTFKFLL